MTEKYRDSQPKRINIRVSEAQHKRITGKAKKYKQSIKEHLVKSSAQYDGEWENVKASQDYKIGKPLKDL